MYTTPSRTAHDAWHRSLVPHCVPLNDALGCLALTFHGFFDYHKLKRIHLAHHAHHSDAEKDPDMPPNGTTRFLPWFGRMALVYATPHQALCFAAYLAACRCFLSVPPLHLLLFIAVPFAASVLRLFVFLTYVPHTAAVGSGGSMIITFVGPKWAALALGFNAVYHAQHHSWPRLPWWRLASVA